MADYVGRTEKTYVSHHYVAKLWRENGLKPHRQGTFKVSRDPAFAEKVADIVGLYLDPPGGAVVLSIDEKRRVSPGPHPADAADDLRRHRAAHRRLRPARHHQPVRVAERRHRRSVRLCSSTRDGPKFLGFRKKAVKPHADKDVHVVLDNLSTHNSPDVQDWLKLNPNVTFHFTPTGSSWLNQVEIWFGNITRQSIRRGTFSSVKVLINQIRATSTTGTPTRSHSSGPPPPTRFSPRSESW